MSLTEVLDLFCNLTLSENVNSSFVIFHPRCNADLQFSPCEGTEFAVLRESEYGSSVTINVADCTIPVLDNCDLNSVPYKLEIYAGVSAYNRSMSKLVSGNPPPFKIAQFTITDNSNPTRVEATLQLEINPYYLPCTSSFPSEFAVNIPEIFSLTSSENSTCSNIFSGTYLGGLERSFQVNSTYFQVELVSADNLFESGTYDALIVDGTNAPTTLYPTKMPTEPPTQPKITVSLEHLGLTMILPVLLSLLYLFIVNYSV